MTLANSMLRQDEAEQVLRDGVALKDMPVTDHGNIAYMLALLLVERNKMDEALPLLETAAKELPQNARIRYNQGLLLLQMHRRVEALAALKAGLEQAPDDADLLYAMVYLHGSAGLQQEAIKYVRLLEKAAPQDERLPDLKRQLGLL
ncbi:Tetratricopeptide repeat protein [compost metagenome]